MKPGAEYTYHLDAGPDSAGVWPYHDHSRSMSDSISGGMYGAISILGRDEEAPDHEFVVYLSQTLDFMTINGRAFVGNTPVFRAKVGDVVQWDVLAIGDDHHTFHVHGHRWHVPAGFEDTRTIGPAESFAVRWTRGCPRDVALPLPRRGSHDERHDRDLPGDEVRCRLLVVAVLLAVIVVGTGAAASTAEVTMPGKFYAPEHLDVLVGTTVTWRNGDRSTHTVTEDDDVFDSGFIRPGQSFSRIFDRSGTYRFHCTIHRFMHGSVSVFGVVLQGPSDPVRPGRWARLTGVAPAGATDVVLVRVMPRPVQVVRSVKPGADGSFRFVVRAPEPQRYRARAAAATSPVVRVRVEPRVSAVRVARGISVRTEPSRAGSRVLLQKYERELFDWVTVARGRLDERSRATISYEPSGREHVRAVVRGSGGWSDGTSRSLVVKSR